MRKNGWAAVLALILSLCLLSSPARAADIMEGTCGIEAYPEPNMYWTLDMNSYALTVTGERRMRDMKDGSLPWGLDVKTAVIGEGVANIGKCAFQNCRELTEIILPESLTEIGESAFFLCTSLPAITLPRGLTSIWEYAFENCTALRSVEVPEGVTALPRDVFTTCYALTTVSLPDGLKSIGEAAFAYCRALENISIPEHVTEIGPRAFYQCEGLKGRLTLPKGLDRIEKEAFFGCSGFAGPLDLPAGITSVGDNAFCYCSGLTGTLSLPDGLKSIGDLAFGACSGFSGILTIPQSVETVGEGAFAGCAGISVAIIPEGVKSLGNLVFYECGHLTDVYYGGTEAQWFDLVNGTQYYDSFGKTEIHFEATELPPMGTMTDPKTGEMVTWILDEETGVVRIFGDVASDAPVFAARYGEGGRLLSVKCLTWQGEADLSGAESARLFWMTADGVPKAPCGDVFSVSEKQ